MKQDIYHYVSLMMKSHQVHLHTEGSYQGRETHEKMSR